MDEGRLGVVFRQEEQHRKFVYMMNDIVRSQFSLYQNCLAREQHETSVKLVKNCAEMRRSIVRQRVLRKCLEMRKRKITTRDPTGRFGQYGGKPLWAMTRDIDRVIANNHPKIRRMKRVEEVMRQSRETGAILDEDAVNRRMEAFFQLKHSRHMKDEHASSPERPKDVFHAAPVRRRNISLLPPVTDSSAAAAKAEEDLLRKYRRPEHAEDRLGGGSSEEMDHRDKRRSLEVVGVVNRLSLKEDSQGRLRGIETSYRLDDDNDNDVCDVDEEKKEDNKSKDEEGGESGQKVEGSAGDGSIVSGIDQVKSVTATFSSSRNEPSGEVVAVQGESGEGQRQGENFQQRAPPRGSDDDASKPSLLKSRSKLILPPIQPNKNLVSKR